ncbi:MAG: iron-sulfur cluster assembly scaffold protein [Syntrophobacteraceae bacterium]|nr:iron-sulfur cluster assembly scaffold protein [Syntrophobacteraceae bacterium]
MAFWQKHSLRFLDMVFRADRRESLKQPDGYGRQTRECGDTIEIYVVLRDGLIDSASFETNGCIYSVACANAAVHLALGRSLPEARCISAASIVDYLETLPGHELHCAELAAAVLQLALTDAQETLRLPWRKFYRST